MGKVMLIDGNSIISRAFYGIPILSTKEGIYTNAVYGFINIFQKLYNQEKPSLVIAAFDLPAPTFRHKLFDEYKGTRKPMPDELRPQIPLLKNLLRLMSIYVCEIEGYEADDILGTYAKIFSGSGDEVTIISGDRDLLQIASDNVKIRIPKTKGSKTEVEDYTSADVKAVLGVTPSEFIDVKALMGDSSDNIPGVPGIGEKTAYKIIAEFNSLENAIANIDKVTPKRAQEQLRTNMEIARLSKTLATINTDAPVLDPPAASVSLNDIFNPMAYAEIQRLELRSLFPLFTAVPEIKKPVSVSTVYRTIKTESELSELLPVYCAVELSAFSLIFDGDNFLGISFSKDETSADFITVFGEVSEERIFELCRPYFEGEGKKLCHNLKLELTRLEAYGIRLNNAVFDTMLAAYILNASRDTYNYDDVAYEHFSESCVSYEAFFGKNKTKTELTVLNNDEARLMNFACEQSRTVYRAYSVLNGKINENGQNRLYYDIELPLVYALKSMEEYGIKVDKDALYDFGGKLAAEIKTLTAEIYDLAGEEFNIASPKQLGIILFEKLGLKTGKKTKSGYSTAADVLHELSGEHPVIDKILEYRTYSKLKSTYVDGLLHEILKDGKIHSTFNQIVTSTGRISSTEPNLQNIPIRTKLGRQLRKVFVPSDDSFVFIDADYSQIELRILAHISQDETFIKAFREGLDIHRLTAAQVLKMPEEFVTPEQRSSAKAVNFGIVYGISAFSLAKDLKISLKEAQMYIDGYFERYPGVKNYLNKSKDDAKQKGYAETIFGRRREIPELKSSNFNQRAFGERAAMNMPIQGSAADIIKIAMVGVYNRLKDGGFRSHLLLQVHDELLIEADKNEIDDVMKILVTEMQNAASLSVPLQADVKLGENWYEAH